MARTWQKRREQYDVDVFKRRVRAPGGSGLDRETNGQYAYAQYLPSPTGFSFPILGLHLASESETKTLRPASAFSLLQESITVSYNRKMYDGRWATYHLV